MTLKNLIKHCLCSAISLLLTSPLISALANETKQVPHKISCSLTEYNHITTDDTHWIAPKPETQIFEHSGKRIVTPSTNGYKYTYDESGIDFFTLKEKRHWDKKPVDTRGEDYLLESRTENILKFRSAFKSGTFQVNLENNKYFGYIAYAEGVETFSGSCIFK